jgi:hypothetical protein
VLAGLLGQAGDASAQTELLSFSSAWKFHLRTNDIGTTEWTGTNYDDSAWLSGNGVFRYSVAESLPAGLPPGTLLPLSNNCQFQGRYIQTIYFRSKFNFPGSPANALLTVSNVMDDAVVVYLNGAEVVRSNLPAGAVSWSTSGQTAFEVTDAGANWSRTFLATNLVQGTNVLAVELHNAGANSSDLVFGLRLLYALAMQPVITSPPASQTVEIGTPVTLSVGVSGTAPLAYQWRRNGGFIPGATNATYAFTAHPTNAGNYTVVVTNAFGVAASPEAVLTVFVNPVVITAQPTNQTVLIGATVTQSVQVTGSPPLSFQWQKDNGSGVFTNILGATSALYVIGGVPGAQPRHSGNYRVVVTNWAGGVTSSVAVLTVIPDTVGPSLLSAVAQDVWPPAVLLTFSERLFPASAREPTNYLITEVGGTNPVAISNALNNGAEVLIRTAPLDRSKFYILTVNNVRDNALDRTNVLAPNSQVAILFETNRVLVPWDQVWCWHEEGYDLGTAWQTNGLPDIFGCGVGAFYFDTRFPSPDLCDSRRTTVLSIGANTYYFTTTFTVPELWPDAALAPDARFVLRHVVDDGAVFYLNGVEIGRYNMPTGNVAYATLAPVTIGPATCITNSFIVTNLVSGTNHLAVEVHQATSNDLDVAFGLELTAYLRFGWTLPAEPPPVLHIEWQGSELVLWWEGGGHALEFANDINGPWKEVQPDMANPYRTSASGTPRRFWRLHRKQF